MAVKVVNNIASLDNLVSTLSIFETYLYMYSIDLLLPNIIQRTATIDKTMNEVKKIRAKNR